MPDTRQVPWVSVDQMREIDWLMVEDVGVSLVRMMENAGRSLAWVARELLGGDAAGRPVTVLAGTGGNGGGGLVAARHLANAGAAVTVLPARPPGAFTGIPAEQLAIVQALRLPVLAPDAPPPAAELIIDALLGYGQLGAPRGAVADLVSTASGSRVLALDVPTGVDPDSGRLLAPAIRAEVTMTLAAPKRGLGAPGASSAVGRLLLADISVPHSLWGRVGAEVEPGVFARGPVVEVPAVSARGRSGR